MRFHDFFAGIGGSSTGLRAAGLEGVVALNHWHYAIELHNANHPEMDHDEADIWSADPRRYRRAEVGWFSPECRAHSRASGKKQCANYYDCDLWRNPTTDPADDRSRLLMESVPHISALAGYRYVLVDETQAAEVIALATKKAQRGELRASKSAYILGALRRIEEGERARHAADVQAGVFMGDWDAYCEMLAAVQKAPAAPDRRLTLVQTVLYQDVDAPGPEIVLDVDEVYGVRLGLTEWSGGRDEHERYKAPA